MSEYKNCLYNPKSFLISTSLPLLVLVGFYVNLYFHYSQASSSILLLLLAASAGIILSFIPLIHKFFKLDNSDLKLFFMLLILQSLLLIFQEYQIFLNLSVMFEDRMPDYRNEMYIMIFGFPSILHLLILISDNMINPLKKWGFPIILACIVIPVISVSLLIINPYLITNSAPLALSLLALIVILAFILGVLQAYKKVEREYIGNPAVNFKLAFLAGLILPFAGLILNALIPFPRDIQRPEVYTLCLLNGIFLLLPSPNNRFGKLFVFFLKAFMMPFSFFFFIFFLPLIPFTVIAIFAMGLGLLILAPSLLFYVHIKRLEHDFNEARRYWGKGTLITVMLLAFSIIPLGIAREMHREKTALDYAISYFYSKDQKFNDMRIYKEARYASRALETAARESREMEVPFISQIFKTYVLGDKKLRPNIISDIYRFLNDKDIPGASNLLGRKKSSHPVLRNATFVQKDKDILITQVNVSKHTDEDGLVKLTVELDIENRGSNSNAEYIGEFKVPENVFISGASLEMDRVKVPAKIFERSAAISVYERIRSLRRDPLLIYYTSERNIRVHIFPFARGEKRKADISFVYPAGLNPEFSFDSHKLIVEDMTDSPEPLFKVFQPEELAKAAPLKREAYLHFIIDSTASSGLSIDQQKAIIQNVSERTGIKQACASICAINILTQTEVKDIRKLIDETEFHSMLPSGFRSKELFEHIMDDADTGESSFPVFVLVSGNRQVLDSKLPELAPYFQVAGETDFILTAPSPDSLKITKLPSAVTGDFQGLKFHPLTLLGSKAVRIDRSAIAQIRELKEDNIYLQGIKLMERYKAARLSLTNKVLRELVDESRKSGILCPVTAYIAVENRSQEDWLKSQEDWNLSDREFRASEVPLSLTVLFIVLLLILSISWRFLKKRKEQNI